MLKFLSLGGRKESYNEDDGILGLKYKVFIAPDSTSESKSISTDSTSHQSPMVPNNNLSGSDYNQKKISQSSSSTNQLGTLSSPSPGLEITSTSSASPSGTINNNVNGSINGSSSNQNSNNNTNHNNNNTTNNNNNAHLNGSNKGTNSFYGYNSFSTHHIDDSVLNSRRPPEGKDNDEFAIMDKVLIGSNSVGNLHKISNDRSTEIFSATKENGKINVQVTVLVDTHHLDNALSGTTLANLKKQRSQSRTNALTENGSVISASHSINSATTNSTGAQSMELSSMVPSSNNLTSGSNSVQSVTNKFSGVTGDVVSDSTRSKKCCLLM